MALYKITVKQSMLRNDVRLVKGMSVDVLMDHAAYSPLHHNQGERVVDAFKRIYDVDIRKANAVNSASLDVVKVG
ncbi:DUF6140 family protein [Belliella sp. DSM 111904]|uniref:DUF6140 family protein n=1 Tax=Belliella filtrata TaxID=2923435 RepID=A0ABS9V1W1_9BACT|nr:DUF6140 family protein [Belliella filtrata]MCH7410411.1 DUF6140 family protein [Belliella filtrata]